MCARVKPLVAVLENVYGVLQVIVEAPFSFLAPATCSDQEEAEVERRPAEILHGGVQVRRREDGGAMHEAEDLHPVFEEATCQVLRVLNPT